MHLRQFYDSDSTRSIAEIAGDQELAIDIQTVLIWVGLLETSPGGADGQFGPLSTEAFTEFQTLTGSATVGTLDKATAKALIETSPEQIEALWDNCVIRPGTDLAGRVVKYMIAKGYHISLRPNTFNIVYIEGVDPDGTENEDKPNVFNDLRMVIKIDASGIPEIVGKWVATTEPGTFYTKKPNRLNPKGAARIQFGQYKAWQVGAHKSQDPALIQAGTLTVCRDDNEDGSRDGDELDTGDNFWIDQHHADDAPRSDIGRWSAGCLVGQTSSGHEEFMDIIMQDHRFKLNHNYMFETAIIPGDDLNTMFPI
jgi:hypothetical protein